MWKVQVAFFRNKHGSFLTIIFLVPVHLKNLLGNNKKTHRRVYWCSFEIEQIQVLAVLIIVKNLYYI